MNYPSLKRTVAFAPAPNDEPTTFITSYGLITGTVSGDQNCLGDSKLESSIDKALLAYHEEFSTSHYGAGDDGFITIRDAILRSVSGEVLRVEEMVLFCSEIVGCFYGNPRI